MNRTWLIINQNSFPHRKLAHVATLNARIGWQNLRTDEFVDEGPYCVTGTDFQNGQVDWTHAYHVSKERYDIDKNIQLHKGDVLVTKDGTIGKVAVVDYLPDLATLNSGVFVVRSRGEGVNGTYLSWVIRSGVFDAFVSYHYAGTTINHLYQNVFETFRFPYPDLKVQEVIADFLERETTHIDNLIRAKQQLVILLKEKLRAQTTELVTLGFDSSAVMAETGIEWLPYAPAHWRIQRIASIYRESNEFGEEGLPILSVSINWGISDRQLDDEDRHRAVNHIEDKTQYKRVRPGDLVYNMMRAWQGAFGVTSLDGLVSPAYVVARPTQIIHSPYFEILLRTPMCIEEFRRASKGIADFRQRLYWEHFRQVVVVLPPFDEQRTIAKKVSEETQKIDRLIEPINLSIERLQEFRSAFITAAVTGQIDVTTWGKSRMTDQQLDTIEGKTAIS